GAARADAPLPLWLRPCSLPVPVTAPTGLLARDREPGNCPVASADRALPPPARPPARLVYQICAPNEGRLISAPPATGGGRGWRPAHSRPRRCGRDGRRRCGS